MSNSARKAKPFGPYSYVTERSCKIDNNLQCRFLTNSLAYARNFYWRDLKAHFGCVNAIEFSNRGGDWIASGGDDKRVLLWNVQKGMDGHCDPAIMKGQHQSNIFSLAFDNCNKTLFSGGNDGQVVVHDIESSATLDVFLHDEAVYGLSVDPLNDKIFANACDDGRVLIYDTRAPPSEDPFCLANYTAPMHAVMFNPIEPRLLATANSKEGIGLWDIRHPKSCVLRYGGSYAQQSCMSVRFNRRGDRLVALRRRLPPVLYNVHSPTALCQFDHSGYYNSCTMKSCCFSGDNDDHSDFPHMLPQKKFRERYILDERKNVSRRWYKYILSGSDDFNLYMWKIPAEQSDVRWVGEAHFVLSGHRSLVNQVRCNPSNQLIVSSGVEKVIKMWSPFPMSCDQGRSTKGARVERPVYTHDEYINLVLRSGQLMTHDYSQESIEEDPRMMAFFDSLVQRELEGWSSEESDELDSDIYSHFVDSDPSESDHSASHSDGDSLSPFTIAFARVIANRDSRDEEAGGSDQNVAASQSEESRSESRTKDTTQTPERLPGQRPNTRRKSISHLIAQKRKEYLTAIMKAERKAKKRKQKRRRAAVKRKRIRLVSYAPSSSDSSSGSSSDSDNDRAKRARCSSPDTSSSSSASSCRCESKAQTVSKGSGQRERRKHQQTRLKRLRARILNSDSDSDNIAAEVQSTNERCSDIAKDCSNKDSESESKSEVTPQLSNKTYTDIPNSSVNEVLDADSSCALTVDISGVNNAQQSTSADCEQNVDNKNEIQNVAICARTNNGQERLALNGSSEATLNGCDTLETTAAAHSRSAVVVASTSNGDTPDSQHETTWNEFKRFKNRLERARRQYRKRGHQDSSEESN